MFVLQHATMTRVQQKGSVDKTAPHLHKHPAMHCLPRYEHLYIRMTLKTIAFSLNDVSRENNVRNDVRNKSKIEKSSTTQINNKILIKTPQHSKYPDILQLNEYKGLSGPRVARKQSTINAAECSFHQLGRALQGS